MANSPKVATCDLQPEMSAHEVVAKIVPELEHARADFVCLNFANPDMVGHTGNYNSIIKAIETVDHCAREVVEAGLKRIMPLSWLPTMAMPTLLSMLTAVLTQHIPLT